MVQIFNLGDVIGQMSGNSKQRIILLFLTHLLQFMLLIVVLNLLEVEILKK